MSLPFTPPDQTLPNSPTIVAPNLGPTTPPPIVAPPILSIIIPGVPSPFYVPNTPASTPTCNCEQSSSSCNCPTPTPYKEPTPEERAEYQRIYEEYLRRQIQTATDNKKYMYIAGGLIIALFIFNSK